MKKLLTLLLTTATALALDPSQPVVRLDADGEIVERRQELPNRYAANGSVTVNYQSAGDVQWWRDGWRQATVTTVTNATAVAIPQPIQQVAAAYKQTMESIYGAGAVTNQQLTRAAVAIDLSLRDDVTTKTGLRLSTWFEILDGYWQRGEIWSYPYGQASYTNETTQQVWEAAP